MLDNGWRRGRRRRRRRRKTAYRPAGFAAGKKQLLTFGRNWPIWKKFAYFGKKEKDVRARSDNLEFLVGNPTFFTLPATGSQIYRDVRDCSC